MSAASPYRLSRSHFAPLVLVLAWLLFLPQTAAAYIDPGTGSMVLQLLLAGIAGIGVLGKLFWRRIGDALGLRRDRSGERTPDA